MKCKWKVIKRYIGIIMMIELHYEHEPLFSTQHITLYYRPHPQLKRYAINVNTTVPVTSSLDTKLGCLFISASKVMTMVDITNGTTI